MERKSTKAFLMVGLVCAVLVLALQSTAIAGIRLSGTADISAIRAVISEIGTINASEITGKNIAPQIEDIAAIREIADISDIDPQIEDISTIREIAKISDIERQVEKIAVIRGIADISDIEPQIENIAAIRGIADISDIEPQIDDIAATREIADISDIDPQIEDIAAIREIADISDIDPQIEEVSTIREIAEISDIEPQIKDIITIRWIAYIGGIENIARIRALDLTSNRLESHANPDIRSNTSRARTVSQSTPSFEVSSIIGHHIAFVYAGHSARVPAIGVRITGNEHLAKCKNRPRAPTFQSFT